MSQNTLPLELNCLLFFRQLLFPVPLRWCRTCKWTIENCRTALFSGDSANLICGNWLKLEPYLLKKYVVASYGTDW